MTQLAIKPTKREVLRAMIDTIGRRLYRQAEDKRREGQQRLDDWRRLQDSMNQRARLAAEDKHADLIARLRAAVAPFPEIKVSLTADLEKDSNQRYKPEGAVKFRVSVYGNALEETIADPPVEALKALDREAAQAWADYQRCENDARTLSHKASTFTEKDLLNDLVLRLPEEAGPHLEALIGMIQQVQEKPSPV